MSEPPSGAAPVAYTDAAGVFPTIARGVEERRVIKDVSWSTRTAAGGGSGGGGSGSGTHTVPELPLRWLPDSHEAFRGTLTVEQWHRAPYAHVFLLAAETRDAYAAGPRAPLRAWIEDAVARGHEWLVLYLPGAGVAATRDAGAAARAYAKVEERVRGDMPARREASRVVRLDIAGGVGVEPRAQWAELLSRLLLCVSAALSARCVAYSEEVRRRWDVKDVPGWNFCGYFCVREALAFVYVQGQVPEEALRHYDELEKLFVSLRARGGDALPMGDAPLPISAEHAASVLEMPFAVTRRRIYENTVQVMEFKQYLFAQQAQLLLKIGRVVDVALRSLAYVRDALRDFERHGLADALSVHMWVFSVCVDLAEACEEMISHGADHGNVKSVPPETMKIVCRARAAAAGGQALSRIAQGVCAFGELFVMARSRLDAISRAQCDARGDAPWLCDCFAAWHPSARLVRRARGWDDGDGDSDAGGQNVYRALTLALRSRTALEALRTHVVAAAAKHFRHAGRERSARALEADLVAAHVACGRYADARALILRRSGEDESWTGLDVWSLSLTALCEAKLGEWSSLVTTVLALLQPALRGAACDALGALPPDGGAPVVEDHGGATEAKACESGAAAATGPPSASADARQPLPDASRERGLARLCEFVSLLRAVATDNVVTTLFAARGGLFSSAVYLCARDAALAPLAEGDAFEALVEVTSGLPGALAVDDVIVEFEHVIDASRWGGVAVGGTAPVPGSTTGDGVPATSGWSGGLAARMPSGFGAQASKPVDSAQAAFRSDVAFFSGDGAWTVCLGESSAARGVDPGPMSPAASGSETVVALSGPCVLQPGARAAMAARGVVRCSGRWALKSVTLCIGHLRIVDTAPSRLAPPAAPAAAPAAPKKHAKAHHGAVPPVLPSPVEDCVMRVTTRADPAAVAVFVDTVGLLLQPRSLRVVVTAAAPGVIAAGAIGVRLPPSWAFVGRVASVMQRGRGPGSVPHVAAVEWLEVTGGGVALPVPALTEGGVFEALLSIACIGSEGGAGRGAAVDGGGRGSGGGFDDVPRTAGRGRASAGSAPAAAGAQRAAAAVHDVVVCYESFVHMPNGVPRRAWACVRHVPPPLRRTNALDVEPALVCSAAGDSFLTVQLVNVLSCDVSVLDATAALVGSDDASADGAPVPLQLCHSPRGCRLASLDSCGLVFRAPRGAVGPDHRTARVSVAMAVHDAVMSGHECAWAGAPPTCTHAADLPLTKRFGAPDLQMTVALLGVAPCADGSFSVAAGSRTNMEFVLSRTAGTEPLEFEARVIETSATGAAPFSSENPVVSAVVQVGDRVALRACVNAPLDVPDCGAFVSVPAVRVTERGPSCRSWILLADNVLRYRVFPPPQHAAAE